MIKLLLRRLKINERGAVAVETAFAVAFVVIPLFLGMVEFGWLFNGWITLTSAAREGVRVAAVSRIDGPVEEAVRKHLEFSALVDFEEIDINRADENDVTVTVTGTIRPIIGLYVRGDENSGTIELNSQGVMRREYKN